MSRLIDADALIDKTDDRYTFGEIGRREHDDIVSALEYAPTIEERKTGRWLYSDDLHETRVCSVCGFDTQDYIAHNFCPNCGAKMEG